METLLQDLRYGIRMLAKKPAFTAVAVLALALGIGANTAIFSVVNTVLLKPLPFKDPDQLMMVWEDNTKLGFPKDTPAPANFVDWKDQNQVFDGMAAIATQTFNLTGVGEPEKLEGLRVSANFFPLLGVEPSLGRSFLPEEDLPQGERVVIISHGLWQRRFGSDASIIGRPLTLNGQSYTVVGVLSKDFRFPDPFQSATEESAIWVPLAFSSEEASNRGGHYLFVYARTKPGVTQKQAQADMDTIAARLQQQYPDTNKSVGAVVTSLHEQVVGDIRPALLILLGAVCFVLLIACANVANLLLARAAARQKETAIRTALGASRPRLVGQFLTESLLLAGLGGIVGLLLAAIGMRVLVALMPATLSQAKDVNIDAKVLGFTLLVSLLTGVIFGLAPALQASRPDLNESLKEGGKGTAGVARARLRGLLVISEVALALVLLIGAGLLINSFLRLRSVDAGFNAANLLTMKVVLPRLKYPDPVKRTAFYDEMLRRIQSLPGVQSAGVITNLPLTFRGNNAGVTIEGRPEPAPDERPIVITRAISPDYFRTMNIPLLKGREFSPHDTPDAVGVVVIGETTARQFWPGEDAIGKRIKLGPFNSDEPWLSVVGVAKDVRQFELDIDPKPQVYFPYSQMTYTFLAPRDLVVRTAGDPLSLASAVRGEVWAVDKDQPVSNISTMEQILSNSVARQRFNMLLLAIFAGVALLLAAVGIYGVISYSVTQRTHEIGIRMALGATSSDVLKLVVWQGLKLVSVGVVIGLSSAFVLTRLMQSLLFGVSATDPVTFASISAALVAVAMLASYIPARKATKVDPMVALRYE
ncbi:MAG TPA: ABC transporter permease [Blastocatellia bacterium]|nr:ABC transporter permease [Blastocatellia bacterium]